MKKELLIALVSSLVDEAISEHSGSSPRSKRGPKGFSGKDFSFEESESEISNILFNYIESKKSELKLKFSDLSESDLLEIRGEKGSRGLPGKGFNLKDVHDELVNDLSLLLESKKDEFKLKFSDLSESDLSEIKGEKGSRGLPGKNGKDFNLEESRSEIIKDIASVFELERDSLQLKLEDLSEDDLLKIKGPRGQKGKQGKDFNLEENRDNIIKDIISVFNSEKDGLKLKFDDLSEDEKDNLKLKFDDLSEDNLDKIRGPRGQKGKQGKSFCFEESEGSIIGAIDNLLSLKKDELKLKFSDLSKDDVHGLRLKFEDLSDENIDNIRGPRGQKGKQGKVGLKGDDGQVGKDGFDGKDGKSIMGKPGLPGVNGQAGKSGINGLDAPQIIDVEVNQIRDDEFTLVFYFNDSTKIETGIIKIPSNEKIYTSMMGGGSDHHSGFYFIDTNDVITVRKNKQSITHGEIELKGELAIKGEYVLIG